MDPLDIVDSYYEKEHVRESFVNTALCNIK